MRDDIRRFILENYLFSDDESELADDASLLEEGLIDSTGVLELVDFLEQRFGISVRDEEMMPENLDSVNALVHYVESKAGGAGAAAR